MARYRTGPRRKHKGGLARTRGWRMIGIHRAGYVLPATRRTRRRRLAYREHRPIHNFILRLLG